MTKVKHTETHDNTLVCKGKLVLIIPSRGEINETTARCFNEKTRNWYTPIIISESELPEIGDKNYDPAGATWNAAKQEAVSQIKDYNPNWKYSSELKVLALPENFSPEILKDIVDGTLKDGEEVFVECEKQFDNISTEVAMLKENEFQIRLNKNNHITILPGRKEDICDRRSKVVDKHKAPDYLCNESWDNVMSILSNPDVSWGTKEAMVRERYNAPTRK